MHHLCPFLGCAMYVHVVRVNIADLFHLVVASVFRNGSV